MRTRPHLAKPDDCHSNGLECEKNHKQSKLVLFKISYYFLFFNCEIFYKYLTFLCYLHSACGNDHHFSICILKLYHLYIVQERRLPNGFDP